MDSAADQASSPARRNNYLTVLVFVVGFLLTASLVWATRKVDDTTEQRLLEQQTRQAAAVLSSAVVVNQQPLRAALMVQPSNGPADAALFRQSMVGAVGTPRTFVSSSLWQREGNHLVRVAHLGRAPTMPAASASTQRFLQRSLGESTFTPTLIRSGTRRLVVYALADRSATRVVYAERAIPADGRSPSDSNDAFSDLRYAIYLGPRAVRHALTTTNVDADSLPFTGRTVTQSIPFGTSELTMVTSARGHLGAPLSHQLPLILAGVGLVLTLVAFGVSRLLVRRRQKAEDSAAFAVALSERLQRALLPLAIPDIDHLEFAVEYGAGTRGVDIGGDWYSIIGVDDDQFAFVIGDVSGKGIDAVAVMARARFTLRAYLLRGDSPNVALSMAARQFDVIQDGHIVTTMVGIGNRRTGEVTVANAGHCQPALLRAGEVSFLEPITGPPLGTVHVSYEPTTFAMESGDTLFFYTDGLIERRGEGIDTGMHRLSTTLASAGSVSVAALVDHAVRSLRSSDAEDDVAVLAFRWTA